MPLTKLIFQWCHPSAIAESLDPTQGSWKKHEGEGGTLKQPMTGCWSYRTPVRRLLSCNVRTYENPNPELAFTKVLAGRKELPS